MSPPDATESFDPTSPSTEPTVLVVGAGMAGLACARALAAAGLRVTVVDKGRGPGGRLATRRHPPHQFDHGAQFFTARHPEFCRWVEVWAEAGLVARWPDRLLDLDRGTATPAKASERWVGVPKMSALAAHLASGLGVRQGVRVVALECRGDVWRAQLDDDRTLEANVCVVTAPPPQTLELLADHPLAESLKAVEITPCVALMVSFSDVPQVPGSFWAEVQAGLPASSPLSWIARDSSKPGRPEGERWVLHGTSEWSREHLDAPEDRLAELLLQAMAEAIGGALPAVEFQRVQRWRYARVTRPLGVGCLYDAADGIGYAGDGCLGSRVEDAYLSGLALAEAILRSREPAADGA